MSTGKEKVDFPSQSAANWIRGSYMSKEGNNGKADLTEIGFWQNGKNQRVSAGASRPLHSAIRKPGGGTTLIGSEIAEETGLDLEGQGEEEEEGWEENKGRMLRCDSQCKGRLAAEKPRGEELSRVQ
ncbi:hypothetical protein EYF80_014843 [Liparis tanakae]|uniref:Uncharacterized protein n=1 Tax=Liparis tanakae TaxID=230148 RepID=A0A4Z2IBU7_9TELE|nr:hypothetical protein EYF80_014843 [Liparis tanakae]